MNNKLNHQEAMQPHGARNSMPDRSYSTPEQAENLAKEDTLFGSAANEQLGTVEKLDNIAEKVLSIGGEILMWRMDAIKRLTPKEKTTSKLKNILVPTKKIMEKSKDIEKTLINREAEIGGQLFGSTPEGTNWRFYMEKPNRWIWTETRINSENAGSHHIEYTINSSDIGKTYFDMPMPPMQPEEQAEFFSAVQWYHYLIVEKIYKSTS